MISSKLSEYIVPIDINGLKGRMLSLPAPKGKSREILYVYGHHSSLERWFGIAEDLNQYGSVVVPDLPGFGGMDSFYEIGMKPTLDNMADYLASFIKMRYKRKKVTLLGLSFGFAVITRMLQRYPELNSKVELLISVVGFSHRDDFSFTKPRYWGYRLSAGFFSRRLPAAFFRNVVLHPALIRNFYSRTHNAKSKFAGLSELEAKQATEMEVTLWRCNEVRTYMTTTVEMLTINNCEVRIPRKLFHVSVKVDAYFDSKIVEQHLRIIFDEVEMLKVDMENHAPTVIADKEASQELIPLVIRQELDRNS